LGLRGNGAVAEEQKYIEMVEKRRRTNNSDNSEIMVSPFLIATYS